MGCLCFRLHLAALCVIFTPQILVFVRKEKPHLRRFSASFPSAESNVQQIMRKHQWKTTQPPSPPSPSDQQAAASLILWHDLHAFHLQPTKTPAI
jgi:hypothetical protein